MGKLSILKEFITFLFARKKWWLVPVILALIILGALILFSESGMAPFIYTLF